MGLMRGFFFELCNIFNSYAPDASAVVKSKSRKEHIFERFYESLVQSYQSERSVKFYADQLCISSIYLTQVIQEVNGQRTREMIADYVVVEIKSLLRNADLDIKDIVRQIGFATQSSLSRFFRRQTGMSPSEYRRTVHVIR